MLTRLNIDIIYIVNFEWDEDKNRRNRHKHKVWFEEATQVFADPRAIQYDDPEHSEDEDRFIMLGIASSGRLLVVIHCYRENEETTRIISARRAKPKEERIYEKGI